MATIQVIRTAYVEYFSNATPGIHADSSGNLMCRIEQPMYFLSKSNVVVMGDFAVVVGPFISEEFDRKTFIHLADEHQFSSIDKIAAQAFVNVLDKLDAAV